MTICYVLVLQLCVAADVALKISREREIAGDDNLGGGLCLHCILGSRTLLPTAAVAQMWKEEVITGDGINRSGRRTHARQHGEGMR